MEASEVNPAGATLTDQDLCEHWGVSWPYVCKLRKEKALPAFVTKDEADAWRAVNAPPRGRRSIGKNRVEKPAHPQTGPGTADATGGGGQSSPANNPPAPKIINIRKFIRKTNDFDGLMLAQAEAVPQIAYGLLELSFAKGDIVETSAQLKNWNESAKAAASAREKFLETQEKARMLLPLDEVEDVTGTFLQEIRRGLLRLDERVAVAVAAFLTPEQVLVVRKACADEIDNIFKQLEAVPVQVQRELAS